MDSFEVAAADVFGGFLEFNLNFLETTRVAAKKGEIIIKMAISTEGWSDISVTVGWMYFVAWSLSFYP